jgi:glycerate-2-kinase
LIVKNRDQLIFNASNELLRKLRKDAIQIIEESINSVNPYNALINQVKTINDSLKIGKQSFDLTKFDRIIVIGGGKASIPMAKALEEILCDRITGGLVNALHDSINKSKLKIIQVNGAAHPIPDENGVNGVKSMLSMVSDLTEKDLVFALISGGGSAIMPSPAENIYLKDIQVVTEKLLKAGAKINELNAVRKHLSSFKGGQLAKSIYPATTIGLILSDVIGDPLDTIASGPTAPDDTTFKDAVDVLKKFEQWDNAPISIKERLKKGLENEIDETPKTSDKIFQRVYNYIIANNLIAVKAGERKAKELGYNTQILSTFIEGEARQLGIFLSGISKSLIANGNPLQPPAAIIIGGETTVKVTGEGKGGRNQEIALSSCTEIDSLSTVISTIGTDGIDGPTEAAGAIVDGDTYQKARKMNLDPMEFLNNNDSFNFFNSLDDLIITGPTGTNVNDIALILVE